MKYLLLVLMLTLGVATASAQNYDYLILQQADGKVQGIATDGLKLTFENGNLVADNGKDSKSVPLGNMKRLYFTSDITAVGSVTADEGRIDVSVTDGKLHVNAPEGSKVNVYSLDGRQVPAEKLPKGVYVVRVNDKAFKVLAR